MAYEYRVVKDFVDLEFDFELVEGDIVADSDFPEPDIPARLIGRGVLKPADQKKEVKRIADGERLARKERQIEKERRTQEKHAEPGAESEEDE